MGIGMIVQTTLGRGLSAAGLCALLAVAAAAYAQPAARPAPARDYKAAPAGRYVVDPSHTGLIARVPHLGFSYSVFRFTGVSGELNWDPANPAADTLSVSVDVKSITTPVKGFAEELEGDRFLKAAQFPDATFVSKAFRPTDATHGKVDGDLTLLGVAKPVTFDVELVGTGKGLRGDAIGATARTMLNPRDYASLGAIPTPIELVIDLEFDRKAP